MDSVGGKEKFPIEVHLNMAAHPTKFAPTPGHPKHLPKIYGFAFGHEKTTGKPVVNHPVYSVVSMHRRKEPVEGKGHFDLSVLQGEDLRVIGEIRGLGKPVHICDL